MGGVWIFESECRYVYTHIVRINGFENNLRQKPTPIVEHKNEGEL